MRKDGTEARSGPRRWDELYDLAAPQEGYFTLRQAIHAGHSPQALEYHLRKGRLERVGHGLYRLVRYPPGELEHLVILWLWSDQAGVFSHETALSLYQLSDVMPAEVHLSVPASWRRRRLRVPPEAVLHFQDIPDSDRSWMGSVPITTPLRTILDCIDDHVSPEYVVQAIDRGLRRGRVTRTQLAEALSAAENRAPFLEDLTR